MTEWSCVCVCVCLHCVYELWNRQVCGFLMMCVNHMECLVSSPKGSGVKWGVDGGVVIGLNDDWNNKKSSSACLRSLQHSLTPTGSCWGQKSARLGQWQLERFPKSGSNQLLIINTMSRVIWCFFQMVAFVPQSRPHHRKRLFVPSKKWEWNVWTAEVRRRQNMSVWRNVNNAT